MGYYLKEGKFNTLRIDKGHLDDVKMLWESMDNDPDVKKRGGNGRTGEKWFSFMNGWDSKKDDVKTTLTKLGFSPYYHGYYLYLGTWGDENRYVGGKKMGQERLFLDCIYPFLEGEIQWIGEEDYEENGFVYPDRRVYNG